MDVMRQNGFWSPKVGIGIRIKHIIKAVKIRMVGPEFFRSIMWSELVMRNGGRTRKNRSKIGRSY